MTLYHECARLSSLVALVLVSLGAKMVPWANARGTCEHFKTFKYLIVNLSS